MEQEKTEEFVLIDKITSGEITSWIQLMIHSDLIGYEIDQNFIIRLLTIYSGTGNELKLIENTIKNSDMIDRYFEDKRLFNCMVSSHRKYIDPRINTWSAEDNRFDSLSLLKEIDTRRPRCLLKYFLNTEPSEYVLSQYRDTFITLFNILVYRTKLRYNMLSTNDKLHDKFKEFIDRLGEIEREIYTYQYFN